MLFLGGSGWGLLDDEIHINLKGIDELKNGEDKSDAVH